MDAKNTPLAWEHLGLSLLNAMAEVAFATVDDNEDLLAQQPTVVVLRVADASLFSKVLIVYKLIVNLYFI